MGEGTNINSWFCNLSSSSSIIITALRIILNYYTYDLQRTTKKCVVNSPQKSGDAVKALQTNSISYFDYIM